MPRASRLSIILVLAIGIALPTLAMPTPSKTAPNQSLESRQADLAVVRDLAATHEVAQALAERGFTPDQVNARLAQLSPQDLHQLAQNLKQLQAAGVTNQEWLWIGIAALAVLIIIVALS